MPATLAYTVQATPTGVVTGSNLAGYRLQMTATGTGTGMDSHVFIFQAPVSTATTSGPADTFYSVASVAQLAALPATLPVSGSPFYRLSALDLVFESQDALTQGKLAIEFMLGELVSATNRFATLSSPVTVNLP